MKTIKKWLTNKLNQLKDYINELEEHCKTTMDDKERAKAEKEIKKLRDRLAKLEKSVKENDFEIPSQIAKMENEKIEVQNLIASLDNNVEEIQKRNAGSILVDKVIFAELDYKDRKNEKKLQNRMAKINNTRKKLKIDDSQIRNILTEYKEDIKRANTTETLHDDYSHVFLDENSMNEVEEIKQRIAKIRKDMDEIVKENPEIKDVDIIALIKEIFGKMNSMRQDTSISYDSNTVTSATLKIDNYSKKHAEVKVKKPKLSKILFVALRHLSKTKKETKQVDQNVLYNESMAMLRKLEGKLEEMRITLVDHKRLAILVSKYAEFQLGIVEKCLPDFKPEFQEALSEQLKKVRQQNIEMQNELIEENQNRA